MWDQILESQLQSESSASPKKKPSCAALTLNRTPTPQHLKRIRRTAAQIPPPLRTAFRALVSGESPWPLLIEGEAGVGKTCAALCLLDYAGGEYYTAAGFHAKLIQAQQGRLEWSRDGRGGTIWPEQLWNLVAAARLVVLDEVGLRKEVSDAHYEAIKTLIDERHGRPLVVVSNIALAAVARVYDDRVFSRLAAGTVIRIEGKDRRIE